MLAELEGPVLKAVRLTRKDVFGEVEKQHPVSEPEDAAVPQIGFVGRDYRAGGTVLLGINPGGGGDTYVRTAADSILLPLIESLRGGKAPRETLDAMFNQYAANMRTWNLWRIVLPVLEACEKSQTEIAYLNWCPFRTRRDNMPHVDAMRRSREVYLAPLIEELAPTRIIALGKKAGNWLAKAPLDEATRYVVPRTIGDSYLSPEALGALKNIKRSSR